MFPSATFVSSNTPRLLGVLRIIVGFLYLQHGMAKLFHVPYQAMFDGLPLFSLMGAAGLLELAGGTLLLIGLFVRPVAFLLSGQMAVAYFMVHAPQAFLPMLNGGELAVVYCFTFLYFALAGAGAFSIDGLRGKA
ncbi:DoxX family protein [Janthinobacterium agaricidamnosum]|uniref:DoxX family protein n=1 Tax=Janthinobacterium agaricidamnosum NBRC 102515 = DSM 9628 TaxID=1349767 RepID=W0V4S2_9BURK|nr:DoxX family protein [Janthinobacterium agaricidamnosum]CDG82590.1 doxX family protein [Janthinobacterium agaricidamnosum NBRC 102515 = DSM 9628]